MEVNKSRDLFRGVQVSQLGVVRKRVSLNMDSRGLFAEPFHTNIGHQILVNLESLRGQGQGGDKNAQGWDLLS